MQVETSKINMLSFEWIKENALAELGKDNLILFTVINCASPIWCAFFYHKNNLLVAHNVVNNCLSSLLFA